MFDLRDINPKVILLTLESRKTIRRQTSILEKKIRIDSTWTLFLDRDGVINKRLVDDYVKSWEEFEFLENVPNSIADFARLFETIVVVTNQQGVGKGLMSESDLNSIHEKMIASVEEKGGRIDKIYFCPKLKNDKDNCRKPLPVMGLSARTDFPNIDFSKSIMVGDSISDMEFGEALGMTNVYVTQHPDKSDVKVTWYNATKLADLTSLLQEN